MLSVVLHFTRVSTSQVGRAVDAIDKTCTNCCRSFTLLLSHVSAEDVATLASEQDDRPTPLVETAVSRLLCTPLGRKPSHPS